MDTVWQSGQPLDECALGILARTIEMMNRAHGPAEMTLDDVLGHSPTEEEWTALGVLADEEMIIVDSGGIRPLSAGYDAVRRSSQARVLRLAS